MQPSESGNLWPKSPEGKMFALVSRDSVNPPDCYSGYYTPYGNGDLEVNPVLLHAIRLSGCNAYPNFCYKTVKTSSGEEICYFAELKPGMFDMLKDVLVFVCNASDVIRSSRGLYYCSSTIPCVRLRPFDFSETHGKLADAWTMLKAISTEEDIELVKYEDYLPFREYHGI